MRNGQGAVNGFLRTGYNEHGEVEKMAKNIKENIFPELHIPHPARTFHMSVLVCIRYATCLRWDFCVQ